MNKENGREIKWIYGLKAWGAFSVVMLHMLACMFPAVQQGSTEFLPGTNVYNFIQLSPVNIFFNGSFAVYVFWTISAFLLSNSYLNQGNNNDLYRKNISKFVRIVVITAFVSLIAFILLSSGCYFHEKAGGLIENSFWTNERDYSSFGFQQFFTEIVWSDWSGSSNLIPPLWTMRYEFLGSILLCAILATGQAKNSKLILFLSVLLVGINAPLICFLFGLVIANQYHTKNVEKGYGILFIILGIFMGAYPATGIPASGVYRFLYETIINKYNYVVPGQSGVHLWYVLGAASIIYGIIKCQKVKKLLSCRFFVLFGRVSMFTYLCHIPILWTFVAWLYYTLESSGNIDHMTTIILCYSLGLIAIYGCSFFLMLLYNNLIKKLVNKVIQCLLLPVSKG